MVQERGLRNAGTALVLFMHPNLGGCRRLGITVSKRVGNAVCRVRIKRLIRDIFRKERGRLPPSVDLVVIARRPAAEADREALLKEFSRAAAYFKKKTQQPQKSAARRESPGVPSDAAANCPVLQTQSMQHGGR